MNWIKSLFFLIIIVTYYYVLGTFVLKMFNYKINDTFKSILAGFFCTFFLGFVVGFPAQYFHINYYLYKYIMLIVIVFIGGIACFFQKDYLFEKVRELKSDYKSILLKHIKRYWFIYMLAAVFSVFSMTNGLPYYNANYDDHYYIGKVVHQVGADRLMTTNFFNGSMSLDANIIRLINTFELTYGFLGDIFTIGLTFFCRGTMAIHNYLLIFATYKLLASNFVEEKYSQFVITPMILLLVPSGYFLYSESAFMRIKMYDGWQFQTAIFYGGSIIRTIAIPTLLIFGKDLIKKIEVKKVIFMGVLYLSMLSFSTIFLIYAVMLTIAFVVIKCVYYYQVQKELNNKKRWIGLLGIFITITLLIASKGVLSTTLVDSDALTDYSAFLNEYFSTDFFVRYALFILIPAYFIVRKKINKMLVLAILFMYLIIYTDQFREILLVAASNYNFVITRFITSICLMIMVFIGIFIVRSYSKLKIKGILSFAISFSLVVVVIGFMYINKDAISENTDLSTGISVYGYSIHQILDNDKLVPDIMVEVGEYIDDLGYGSYYLLTPNLVFYNNRNLMGINFVMISNKVETCYMGGCNNMTTEELEMVKTFFNNKTGYEEIQDIIVDHKIDYILVTERLQKEELEENGFIVVISNIEENREYYLLESGF